MLHQFHQHIGAALARERRATLATCGPAGLQAQVLTCAASGLRVYLLLPRTSDQLLNLESAPEAVVATAAWTVRGQARVCAIGECPHGLGLWDAPEAPWSVAVEVASRRVTIAHPEGWGASETVDVEG